MRQDYKKVLVCMLRYYRPESCHTEAVTSPNFPGLIQMSKYFYMNKFRNAQRYGTLKIQISVST